MILSWYSESDFFFYLCKDKQKITLNIHSMRQSYLTLFRNTHLNKTMRSMTLVSQQKVPSGSGHKLQRRLSKHTAPYGDKTRSQHLFWSFYTSPCKDKMEKLPAKHDSLPESAPSALLPFTFGVRDVLDMSPEGPMALLPGRFDTGVSFKTWTKVLVKNAIGLKLSNCHLDFLFFFSRVT